MIIHRLRAQRFGCLADCTVSFGPGLNIVSGPNESGKSTLQRALLLALLDRPARRKANGDSRQWGADRLFQLDVEFETKDGRHWVLSKDYEENKARLAGVGGTIASWEEIQNVLSGALGTCSPRALQSTCCVAQDELAAISEGRKEICRALETMVTGGDDDTCTADAISALQRAAQGLRRGLGARGATNPGRLATLTERKRALEDLAARYRESLEQDDLARQRLADSRARLAQLESALQPRLAAREAADHALALTERLREWREKESALSASLERIAQAEGQISSATAGLTELGLPPLPEAEYYELTRLHERVALLRSQALERAQSAQSS
ncbi:MAG: AAA family ATPase, partial [Chloroflexota bacterium]|nr:AAA family ATPase [Chloroflexota bacterium]